MDRKKSDVKEFPADAGYTQRVEDRGNEEVARVFLNIGKQFLMGDGLAFAYTLVRKGEGRNIVVESSASIDNNLDDTVKERVFESLKFDLQRLATALVNGSLDDLASG